MRAKLTAENLIAAAQAVIRRGRDVLDGATAEHALESLSKLIEVETEMRGFAATPAFQGSGVWTLTVATLGELKAQLRDKLASQTNAELEELFLARRVQLSERVLTAAAAKDRRQLQRLAAGAAAYQLQLIRWNEGAGKRTTKNLIDLAESFQLLRNDIAAAMRSEPDIDDQWGDGKGGDAWKDEE